MGGQCVSCSTSVEEDIFMPRRYQMDSEKINVEVNETEQTGQAGQAGPSWFSSEKSFKEMLYKLYNVKVA